MNTKNRRASTTAGVKGALPPPLELPANSLSTAKAALPKRTAAPVNVVYSSLPTRRSNAAAGAAPAPSMSSNVRIMPATLLGLLRMTATPSTTRERSNIGDHTQEWVSRGGRHVLIAAQETGTGPGTGDADTRHLPQRVLRPWSSVDESWDAGGPAHLAWKLP